MESRADRIRNKLLGKTSWYKGRRKNDDEDGDDARNRGRKKGHAEAPGGLLKTRAVLFLEQTPQGELSKRVREKLQDLEPVLGYRIKVIERTGRSLQSVFSQTGIWKGTQCGRGSCITCNQEGEENPDCTKPGVVYESICVRCNPSSTNKGELRKQESQAPSLYVGESSRSVQERAEEQKPHTQTPVCGASWGGPYIHLQGGQPSQDRP